LLRCHAPPPTLCASHSAACSGCLSAQLSAWMMLDSQSSRQKRRCGALEPPRSSDEAGRARARAAPDAIARGSSAAAAWRCRQRGSMLVAGGRSCACAPQSWARPDAGQRRRGQRRVRILRSFGVGPRAARRPTRSVSCGGGGINARFCRALALRQTFSCERDTPLLPCCHSYCGGACSLLSCAGRSGTSPLSRCRPSSIKSAPSRHPLNRSQTALRGRLRNSRQREPSPLSAASALGSALVPSTVSLLPVVMRGPWALPSARRLAGCQRAAPPSSAALAPSASAARCGRGAPSASRCRWAVGVRGRRGLGEALSSWSWSA
jgi:hypothetical protein